MLHILSCSYAHSPFTIRRCQKPPEYADYERRLRHEDISFIARLRARCPRLTQREIQIVVLMRLGLLPPAIHKVLPRELGTIYNHCRNIRKKLDIKPKESLYQAIGAI